LLSRWLFRWSEIDDLPRALILAVATEPLFNDSERSIQFQKVHL